MNALTAPCLFALSTYALQSPQLYAACLALVHVCHGGIFSLFPSVTSDLFGHKNVGPVFSLLFAARLAAVALAAIWINVGKKHSCKESKGYHISLGKEQARNSD
uniref:Transporter, major facilitator family protein n=1 Tax=Toxoplasma gondii TgCATBr9 TaxID=943120 RepID=A0A2T6IH77_TOXGO|nr:transporter, major facilitator family protein [Toxoplasma gondii TgCATBr9]